MTARYRCPYCGTGLLSTLSVRKHQAGQHREKMLDDLGVIESYGTRKPLDPPRNAAKPHPPLNPGVSGEGDE